jgi:hypothetical protein
MATSRKRLSNEDRVNIATYYGFIMQKKRQSRVAYRIPHRIKRTQSTAFTKGPSMPRVNYKATVLCISRDPVWCPHAAKEDKKFALSVKG